MIKPSTIQFYPTLRCNYGCSFCFNRNLPLINDVTVSDFRKIASMLGKLEIPYLDILGGEPTLHPQLPQLVDMIKSNGLKTTISTNGSNVPILSTLSKKYDKESVRAGISINTAGISHELHRYILGYRPVLKSIMPRGLKIPEPCRPYVGMPGISYFLLYKDVLNGEDLNDSVSFDVFFKALARLKEIFHGIDGVFCSGFIPDTDADPILKNVRCPAGTTKLSLLPDGAAYPCYLFFRYKEFELGNLLRDDFRKIWQNPILNFFRTFENNACPRTTCMLFDTCHGGCPAIGYIFHKDLRAPDPRCVKRQGGNTALPGRHLDQTCPTAEFRSKHLGCSL